jgi:hypothetical protein
VEHPVDLGVLRARLSVDELPPHVGRRGHSVDLDHVVFPLDPLRGVVTLLGLAVLMVVPVMAVLMVVPVMAVLMVVPVMAVLGMAFVVAV